MPIVDHWITYGKQGTRLITGSILQECINVMSGCSLTHANRDFKDLDSTRYPTNFGELISKINTAHGQKPGSTLRAGPFPRGKYNWIKVAVGYNSFGVADVVIFYHLLRHRLQANPDYTTGQHPYWSTSVGFRPGLLEDPLTPHDITPYQELATEIAVQMKSDLSTIKPSGTHSLIYDDIDYDAPDPTQPDSNTAKRRSRRIGELGYIAQSSPDVLALFNISDPYLDDRPEDQDGNKILGWGRNAGRAGATVTDMQIIVTELEII